MYQVTNKIRKQSEILSERLQTMHDNGIEILVFNGCIYTGKSAAIKMVKQHLSNIYEYWNGDDEKTPEFETDAPNIMKGMNEAIEAVEAYWMSSFIDKVGAHHDHDWTINREDRFNL